MTETAERILFIGDVVGRPGRRLLKSALLGLRRELSVTLVVANGENAAGGVGITRKTAEEIFSAGVDVITTGNHVWDKREALEYVRWEPRILRPSNYPPGSPGRGFGVFQTSRGTEVIIANLNGRVFIDTAFDCPFRSLEDVLRAFGRTPSIPLLVDFHAEATSEKIAMGRAFDGRITAVLGTHTHVQTNDARILPGGTAYVTDIGMTGPSEGVLGVHSETVVDRFYTQLPGRFKVASGPTMLNGAVVTLSAGSTEALQIDLVNRSFD